MTIDEAAQKLWDYMLMHNELQKADIIFVPGHSDTRVAEYAGKLFLEGWAPHIVFSGSGSIHQDKLPGRERFKGSTEAEVFRDIAVKMGVPSEAIIVEDESQNTGDNFDFSIRKLNDLGILPKSMIAVMKPYAERRLLSITNLRRPDLRVIVTSPPLSFEEYPMGHITKDHLINMMVGDIQRLIEYPKKGLQAEQNIPANVLAAYDFLVSKGYTQRLIQN